MTQSKDPYRRYIPAESITFRKTNESFGGLSNMASGYILWVNGTRILTSEAIYQACRFPHLPEVQRSIIMQGSPMTAKMKSKPFRDQSRADWDQVRVKIMRWCLRVKLAQNWDKFGELLLLTGDKAIVEDSRKDRFWGAVMNHSGQLEGRNALGRLLMELREELKGPDRENLRSVKSLDIPEFLLYAQPIGLVEARATKREEDTTGRRLKPLGTRRPDEPVKTYAPPATKADLFSEPEEPMQVKEPKQKTPLKPYPAYKPADVPWLQQVPEHWSEMKVKYIFRERVQKGYPTEPLLAATQSKGVVTKEAYGLRTVEAQKDLHLLKLVEKGDFVISLRSFQGGIEFSYARGIISPAYTILRTARPCDPGYLKFLLKSASFIDGLKLFITGIREGQNIDYSRLARTHLPWPPLEEQQFIAKYLHALDAKVKRYIRTKRNLIARLQEQKQAIIQHAVTRGLDPNVKFKSSGVEWLGEVPVHWEVRKLKQIVRAGKKITYGIVQPGHPDPKGRYMVRGQDYSFGWVAAEKIFRVSRAVEEPYKRSRVEAGDLVYTIIGAGVGNVEVVPNWLDGSNITQTTARIAVDKAIADPRFVKYCLIGPVGQSNVDQYVKGAAQPGLNLEHVRIFQIPFPPIAEQAAIAEYVEGQLETFDMSISRLMDEIKMMLEYHTRLIADVVTGAVDVRAAAQALPVQPIDQSADETIEEEPLSMAANGEAEYGSTLED